MERNLKLYTVRISPINGYYAVYNCDGIMVASFLCSEDARDYVHLVRQGNVNWENC